MKIVIDTDIGGDVDDVLAVALALSAPGVQIVSITLVYMDNTWRQGMLPRI